MVLFAVALFDLVLRRMHSRFRSVRLVVSVDCEEKPRSGIGVSFALTCLCEQWGAILLQLIFRS